MVRPRLPILTRPLAAVLLTTGRTAHRPRSTAHTARRDPAVAMWARLTGGLPRDRRHPQPAGSVRTRPLLTLAALLAFGATVAGCSPDRHASPMASPSVNDRALALSIGREFAQCARQHGRPDFPDPAIQNGVLAFPGATKQDQRAVQDACVSILQRLPASMRQQNRPPTAEALANLRRFAQCMREHGVPDWPDPKADGTFPIIGTTLEAEGKSQRIIDGEQACAQYFSGGINAS